MTDGWRTVGVDEVRVGQRIRVRGQEFDVARIDSPFLDSTDMVCFIEDSPERWQAIPARRVDSVEILDAG